VNAIGCSSKLSDNSIVLPSAIIVGSLASIEVEILKESPRFAMNHTNDRSRRVRAVPPLSMCSAAFSKP